MAIEENNNDILLQGIVQSELEGLWYLDTSATSHMTSKRNLFYELDESYKGNVRFGDDSRIMIEGKGKILLNSKGNTQITLTNVVYTPKLKANILSLGCLDEQGCQIKCGKGVLKIRDENGTLLTTVKQSSGQLYLLNFILWRIAFKLEKMQLGNGIRGMDILTLILRYHYHPRIW